MDCPMEGRMFQDSHNYELKRIKSRLGLAIQVGDWEMAADLVADAMKVKTVRDEERSRYSKTHRA